MKTFLSALCLAVVGASVAGAGVLGCGSTDDGASDGGSPESDASGSDANPPKGDGSIGAEGGSDGGGDASITHYASLTLAQPGPTNYVASADFSSGSSLCVTTMSGACYATVCTIPPPVDGGAPPGPSVAPNAGDLTITGIRDAGAVTLTYGPIGDAGSAGYFPKSGNAQFFKGGDLVTAAGAGGADLPAFATVSVAAPDDIVLTSPACAVATCPDLDRTVDLAVTWTGGGSGKLQAFFESIVSSGTTTVTALGCNFDSAAHAGTVPSALLMKLGKTGDPGVLVNAESFIPASFGAFTIGATQGSFNLEGQGVLKTNIKTK